MNAMSTTDSGQGGSRQAKANPASAAESKEAGKSPAASKPKKAESKRAKAAAKKESKNGKGSKSQSSNSPSGTGSSRLKPGALDGIVLGYMRKHRDELPIGPTGIAKGTGRSSGAIGNCLERLKKEKKVRRVEDKPRKYDLPVVK
jgi:hypothetical protein